MLEDHEPIFGKNVIETLSEGMYDNPLFLFREYVQNAADAIDEARNNGILKSDEGQIEITIDSENRKIVFEDNGIGIPRAEVKSMLANIGASKKDRTTDKGFRGIGRLGGLGYCVKVRFETSAKEEDVSSCLEWDARNLHEILMDPSEKISASEVIKRITSTWEKACDKDKHFFKVSLIEIHRTNDELLDAGEVRKYLSMCSVPCDHIPIRSWPLFQAQAILPEMIESHRRQKDES
ncbi:MAG: ATP-binding protein [Desulfobulbaceae bacterium]|jgi:molecular chaperone HtpG|nr:ATP-binding protein [Desulfobulbaceae bacterium]